MRKKLKSARINILNSIRVVTSVVEVTTSAAEETITSAAEAITSVAEAITLVAVECLIEHIESDASPKLHFTIINCIFSKL